MKVGDLKIDREQYIVRYNGEDIILARKNLNYWHSCPNQKVFLRNEILNTIWGTEVIVGDHYHWRAYP